MNNSDSQHSRLYFFPHYSWTMQQWIIFLSQLVKLRSWNCILKTYKQWPSAGPPIFSVVRRPVSPCLNYIGLVKMVGRSLPTSNSFLVGSSDYRISQRTTVARTSAPRRTRSARHRSSRTSRCNLCLESPSRRAMVFYMWNAEVDSVWCAAQTVTRSPT